MPARHRAYLLSPLAERDLEDIWSYTDERWSAGQAAKYHAALIAAFESLRRSNMGGASDIRDGYWKLPVGSHVVYYRLNEAENAVEVVRILHQRMDADRHL